MQPIASTRPSSACLRRNLRDGATCTTRSRVSASLQARLGNPSQTCFDAKQAARSRRVSRADLPPSVLWRNRQTEAHLVLRPKPRNHRGDFEPPNHLTRAAGFEAQTEKPSTTLVLRLNQETRASSLHVPGADRTRRHPTSRPPGHRVHDLCDHPRSSAPGLLLLPRSSSLHAMPHLPLAHHETSKCDSPNETKIKEKQNKTILDSNSNLAKSMTHHNQTK
jgi:hypothetical protein